MRSSNRGIGIYFLIVAAVLLLISFMSNGIEQKDSYSYKTFLDDLKNEQVTGVLLSPNAETPTGDITVTLKNGAVHKLYVADITEAEKNMQELFPAYEEEEVKKENILITYGIPIILSVVVVMIIMAMMNSQGAAAAGGNRMMNFGKSGARMVSPGQTQITFKDVAGLVEEKEDLE